MRATAKCFFCGDTVNVGEIGVYRKVSGWSQVRPQGGINSLAFMTPPEAWAHSACIDREKQIKSGKVQQEETLF
jgi:hypothetical protein